MAYYVRKVQRSKWCLLNQNAENDICNYKADAIANDLRTFANTLSLWRTEDITDEEIEPVLVINSLLGDNISDIDLIFIPDCALKEFSLKQTEGDTIVAAYRKWHYDVVDLTIGKHLKFAEDVILKLLMKEAVDDEAGRKELIKKLKSRSQCEMICRWIMMDQINPIDLKDRQLKDICTYLSKKRECSAAERKLAGALLEIVCDRQSRETIIVKEDTLKILREMVY